MDPLSVHRKKGRSPAVLEFLHRTTEKEPNSSPGAIRSLKILAGCSKND